ncbi:MAG: hypothetical protein JNM99_01725 [Verrucomicrobiaceae bacterium]|nr:hypothetical protein [Verrucomicrobiaceae bacterium]
MSWIVTWISMAAAALPPAPVDDVHDDARIFGDESRRVLSVQMEEFRKDTGFRLFIDTNTYIELPDNANDRARSLLKAWGGKSPSVVVCIDRASQALPTIVASDAIWQRTTTLELMTAIRASAEEMGSRPITEAEAMDGMKALMDGLKRVESVARQREQFMSRQDLIIAAVFGIALVFGTGLIWLVVRQLRSREASLAKQHHFPDVEVGQRFGAPNGGGFMVEISYRK